MTLIIEPLVLFLVIIAVIIAYLFLDMAKDLIINTVLGLIILALSNIVFHLGIKYTIWVILVCAIGGIPGAILVIVFHVLNIAF